jgi:hypothetical protein
MCLRSGSQACTSVPENLACHPPAKPQCDSCEKRRWVVEGEVGEAAARGDRAKPLERRDQSAFSQLPKRPEIRAEKEPVHPPRLAGLGERPAGCVVVRKKRGVEARARDHLLTENRPGIDLHQHETAVACIAAEFDGRGPAVAEDIEQPESERRYLGLVRDLLGAAVTCAERKLANLALGTPGYGPPM